MPEKFSLKFIVSDDKIKHPLINENVELYVPKFYEQYRYTIVNYECGYGWTEYLLKLYRNWPLIDFISLFNCILQYSIGSIIHQFWNNQFSKTSAKENFVSNFRFDGEMNFIRLLNNIQGDNKSEVNLGEKDMGNQLHVISWTSEIAFKFMNTFWEFISRTDWVFLAENQKYSHKICWNEINILGKGFHQVVDRGIKNHNWIFSKLLISVYYISMNNYAILTTPIRFKWNLIFFWRLLCLDAKMQNRKGNIKRFLLLW